MNEESQISKSKKNIHYKEIYNFLPSVNEKSSNKLLPALRSKLYFQNSPRILPILNIKPPSMPKSSDVLNKCGFLIKTFRSDKIDFFMSNKTFEVDGRRRNVTRRNNVKIDGKLNRSGVLLRTADLDRKKIRMNLKEDEKKNELVQSKEEVIKKKLFTLEEIFTKTYKLSGWETN